MITEDSHQGFRRLTLSGRELEVDLLPELGGKIVAIRRPGGQNVLLSPPEFPYRRAAPGADFDAFDTSGFDECFPTVAACKDPDVKGERFPDHGELWSRPFEVTPMPLEQAVASTAYAVKWGGELRRVLRLEGRTLRIDYELSRLTTPTGPENRHYLWSAHPLLAVSKGSRIYLPRGVDELTVEWSRKDRLGKKGEKVSWPIHTFQESSLGEDLSLIGDPSRQFADKLFTDELEQGWAALYDPDADQSVIFRFDVNQTPYLGLWICQGGWPTSRDSRHFTVALEPCSGRPDSLFEAAKNKQCPSLAQGGVALWTLEIELSDGEPVQR